MEELAKQLGLRYDMCTGDIQYWITLCGHGERYHDGYKWCTLYVIWEFGDD